MDQLNLDILEVVKENENITTQGISNALKLSWSVINNRCKDLTISGFLVMTIEREVGKLKKNMFRFNKAGM